MFLLAMKTSIAMRRARWMLALVACASWASWFAAVPADAQIRNDEYEVKAAFLYNLTKFVQWPPVGDADDQLVIGVVGNDFLGSALRNLVTGKSVQGRDIVVRFLRRDDNLRDCHILFVGALETRHLADILSRIEVTGVLTVGESSDFLRDGGLVRFYVDNNRVRVEIAAARAAEAGLKISSQLLSLAK